MLPGETQIILEPSGWCPYDVKLHSWNRCWNTLLSSSLFQDSRD